MTSRENLYTDCTRFRTIRVVATSLRRIRACLQRKAWIYSLSIVLLGIPAVVSAETQSLAEVEAKLRILRSSMSDLNKQLALLQDQQKKTQKLLAEQKKFAANLAAESQTLNDRLRAVTDERRVAERVSNEAEERKKNLQVEASRRLRVLYMANDMSLTRGLLERTSVREVDRTIVYLAKIRGADAERFKAVARASSDARAAFSRLESLMAEQKNAAEQLAEKKATTDTAIATSKELAKQIADQRDEISASLKSLKGEAANLENIIASITSGQVESPRVLDAPLERTQPPALDEPEARPTHKPADGEVKLNGLFGSRVSLEKPVAGRVVTGYGKTRVGDLKEEVFNKGLEYNAAVGASIRCISAGKVAYVGQLPTFGNVVIVDHGARSYSLYGRLENVAVVGGDSIASGAQIGTTGELDEAGRNFYFEIRRNGIPVNPATILRSAK